MLPLVATCVLAAAPTPVLFAPLDLNGVPADFGPRIERGLRGAFAGSSWPLQSPAEREAELARARDAGVQLQGARVLLSCNALGSGDHATLQCRLTQLADHRLLGTERVRCGKDLDQCADELGRRALALVRGAAP